MTRNALSGEYYLTDVPGLLLRSGKRVEVIEAVPPEDVLSINTPEDLAKVDAIYRSRRAERGAGGAPGAEGGTHTGRNPSRRDGVPGGAAR